MYWQTLQLLDIANELFKQNADNFSNFFVFINRNYVIESCGFVEQLKYVDLISVIDENSSTEGKNYKAVSILQNI